MKASELVKQLQQCIEEHGDLDVHVEGYNSDEWAAVLGVELSSEDAVEVTGDDTPFLVIETEF